MAFRYDHNVLWYSHLHPPIEGVNETWFYDEALPFKKTVEARFDVIRHEVLHALKSTDAVFDAKLNNAFVNAPGLWQSFSFIFWDHIVSQQNKHLCPQTIQTLNQIPGMVSASVSVMRAQTQIKPHRGNTNAIYRCHLPLVVPAGLPQTGLYVGYESRPWEEGKLLVFNDAAYHKAWNNTESERLVLIFDVLRPQFLPYRHEICAEVLKGITAGT